jgi:hypothetical protein
MDDDIQPEEENVIETAQFENRIENLLKELHATQNSLLIRFVDLGLHEKRVFMFSEKMLSYIVIALLVWVFIIR